MTDEEDLDTPLERIAEALEGIRMCVAYPRFGKHLIRLANMAEARELRECMVDWPEGAVPKGSTVEQHLEAYGGRMAPLLSLLDHVAASPNSATARESRERGASADEAPGFHEVKTIPVGEADPRVWLERLAQECESEGRVATREGEAGLNWAAERAREMVEEVGR